MPKSLRSRLIISSLLWTAGLLMMMHMASMLLIHALPSLRGMRAIGPVIAGIICMIAGFYLAKASLAPFLTLPEKVTSVQKGDAERIDGEYPTEVQPLIDSLNALIADREKSISRAYATAGDLAHGLKTPLALLAREAESARAQGNDHLAEAIIEQIQRMTNQVDYHLARSRVAASGPAVGSRCDVAPCVAALVRTLSKLYAERGLNIAHSVDAPLTVRVRREDLDEILGNVLDNACKWARGKVTLTVEGAGSMVTLSVEDDGPGLPDALRAAVMERGVRLDEAAPGSGLGLSIVRDLTEHYSGSVALDTSALGGLRVRISLPMA